MISISCDLRRSLLSYIYICPLRRSHDRTHTLPLLRFPSVEESPADVRSGKLASILAPISHVPKSTLSTFPRNLQSFYRKSQGTATHVML